MDGRIAHMRRVPGSLHIGTAPNGQDDLKAFSQSVGRSCSCGTIVCLCRLYTPDEHQAAQRLFESDSFSNAFPTPVLLSQPFCEMGLFDLPSVNANFVNVD